MTSPFPVPRAAHACARAPEHPALDGTERLAEPLGELRLAEPSVVGELERLPLRVGKVAQRGLHALALQPQERVLLRALDGRLGGQVERVARRRCSRRTASTARRCTSVRIHVLALPRSGMKRDGGSPDGEERLLHRVLGERLVAQDAQARARTRCGRSGRTAPRAPIAPTGRRGRRALRRRGGRAAGSQRLIFARRASAVQVGDERSNRFGGSGE